MFLSTVASFIEVTIIQTTWWLTKRVASATYHGACWAYTQTTNPKLGSVVVVKTDIANVTEKSNRENATE